MQSLRRLLQLNLFLIAFGSISLTQTNPNLETGFKAYGSYDDADFDSISLTNYNLILHIPVFGYPQRGKLSSQLELMYNNKGWVVNPNCTTQTCSPVWGFQGTSVQAVLDTNSITITYKSVKTGSNTYVTIFTAQEQDGSTHQLAGTNRGGYESIDASGIYFNDPGGLSSNFVVNNREGIGFTTASTSLWQDTNGNYVNRFSPYTDTVGRTFGASVNDGSGTSGCKTGLLPIYSAYMSSYPGPNGTTRIVKSCYANLSLKSNFHIHTYVNGILYPVTESTTSEFALQSVLVYNGVSWASSPQWVFQYANNSDGSNYGDLTQVTLPTGGTISYAWGTRSFCGAMHQITPVSRGILSKTVNANDGTGLHTTTYGPTVTDPAGNDTVHTITGLNGSCALYETQTDYWKGSSTNGTGTLLKTVVTAYSWTTNPFDTYGDGTITEANVVPTSVTTKWPIPNTSNFLVSQVQSDYDQGFIFGLGTNINGTYGMVKEKREYGFGANAPGPLLRKTDYTYLALNNSNYLSANILTPITQVTVYDGSGNMVSQTTNTYDGAGLQSSGISMSHNSVGSYRGNLTMVQKWLNTGGTVTTAQTSYYDTGMPYQSFDLKSNVTTYTYGSAYYGAYLTQTQFPNTGVAHTISGAYDFNTGLLTSFTDQNSQVSSYGYDVLGRMTSASYPDGGSTGFQYTDTIPVQIQKTTAITSSLNKVTNSVFDGLGRISEFQLHDPECSTLVKTDSAYNFDTTQHTSFSTVTNPYCQTSDSTYGSTRTDSDALGRVIKITQADGSVATSNYAANSSSLSECTTAADEAGKARTSCTDGLGRMTGVWEDPTGLNYETDYGYNMLDDLTSVNQKGDGSVARTRSFSYDSLSRLSRAINPESGTISYSYSNSSSGCAGDPTAVCTKVAPAPNQTGSGTVTTTYTFDALNRITQKSYNDGSTSSVFFAYDSPSSWGVTQNNIVGRLEEEWTGTSCCGTTAEIFGYDQMGRVVMNEQYTPNMGYRPVNYTYDLAGDLTSGSNGEGYTISYNYDAAMRPTQVTSNFVDSQHPATLFTVDSSVGYFPPGELRKGTFGNGLVETSVYNNRLQPCLLDVVNTSSVTLQTCNDGTPGGNVIDFWVGYGTTNNNGNILNWNATGVQSFIRIYGYDSLNRLSTMTDAASGQNCKGLQWTIDPWGNRTNQAVTSGSCLTFSATATSQNQLSGYQYDAAGNMTYDGNHHYTYDAENRIVQVDSGSTATYVYDAEGRRAEKTAGGWDDYIHDLSGRPIAEAGANGWNVGYVYLGGSLLAQYRNSTTYFIHTDHLGSTRLLTNLDQSIYDSLDYQPFGEQIAGDTGTTHKFTGKERDSESNLDMFGARYYGSTLGRFMTPDWAAKPTTVPYANFGNPQSLNLYSYVENNPTTVGDPDGHEGLVTDIEAGLDEMSQEFNQVANEIGGGTTTGVGPAIAVGTALGVEAYALIDAHATQVKADADMQMQIEINKNVQEMNKNKQAEQQEAEPQAAAASGGARKGGGRNEQKSNEDRQDSAKINLTKAKSDLATVKASPPSKGRSEAIRKAEAQVKHWQRKAAEKSENHSRIGKNPQQ